MSGPVHHVYRDLLKAVRKHAAADHFSSFVRQSFRDSIASKDADALQKSLALAKDYAYLVRSVHAHKVRNWFLRFFIFLVLFLYLLPFIFQNKGYVWSRYSSASSCR